MADEPDIKPSKPERDAKGRILPGNSGNPKGAPKDLAAMRALIRERGPDMLRVCMGIATGEEKRKTINAFGTEVDQTPSFADMLRAQELCFSYWLGKPAQSIEVTTPLDERAEQLRAELERLRNDPRTGPAMLAIAESQSSTRNKGEQ